MQTTFISTSPTGISIYELSNARGMRVRVVNYGARLFSMHVPTRSGDFVDVLAGFDTPDEFRGDNPYFNALVGRVANRIARGRFTLDGRTYCLAHNDGPNHLHGGLEGFDRKLWTVVEAEGGHITMRYVSPDGEEGYPGTLAVTVTYTLDESNALSLDYEATADRATPVNLTNHAYFNLDGDFRSVLSHEVSIAADRVIAADDLLIPTGELTPVAGTLYDFRTPHAVGAYLTPAHPPVIGKDGYDIGYVLLPHAVSTPVATAYSARTGIRMTVYTDRPVLQFYTGNFLDGTVVGKHSYPYQSAFCMETQGYSDAPNQPHFPSVTLPAGETYRAHTSYVFSVD